MKGRKPAIKPLGDDDVIGLPSAMSRVPDPPEMLKGLAKELWASIVGELVVRNIYADDCREAAMAYCVQLARFIEAEADVAERGKLITIGKHIAPNPSLQISDRACNFMLRIGAELGLSAASRKRIAKVRGISAAPAQKFLKRT